MLRIKFKEVILAMLESWERYWLNKHVPFEDDEVLWLRTEIAKLQQHNKWLIEKFTSKPEEAVGSKEEFEPINNIEPWHLKRQRLEREDRKKLEDQIRKANEEVKTTEELEEELGINHG